jgi:hypothetical protein
MHEPYLRGLRDEQSLIAKRARGRHAARWGAS